MDFARKQLEKYGWSEGKGLGRNENGISTAVKPKLKFDNAGLGHNAGEEFTNNWWEKLFDKAAKNIHVEIGEKEVKVKSKEIFKIKTKDNSSSKFKNSSDYGSFLKISKLTGNTIESLGNSIPIHESTSSRTLTDEELFAACSGRTAHKGARHGIKQNGKLSRIEKQEKMLLKKMRKVSLSDNGEDTNSAEKKLKKLKKHKNANNGKEKSTNLKKKKKHKSVSFNETVTTIYATDPKESFDNELGTKDDNSSSSNQDNVGSGSDEGIEQDFENNNNDSLDHHQSFEIVQFKISDLSKAERKKLKKKRKLESRKSTATGIFLQTLNDEVYEDENMTDTEDKLKNLKKRKFIDDMEQENCKQGCLLTESPDKNKSKKDKRKKQKQRKLEEKQYNYIVNSFDNICQISQNN